MIEAPFIGLIVFHLIQQSPATRLVALLGFVPQACPEQTQARRNLLDSTRFLRAWVCEFV